MWTTRAWIIGAICLHAHLVAAEPVRVTGRVMNANQVGVGQARIQILANGRRLFPIPQPVRLDGSFALTVDVADGELVRCEATAPGFRPEARNLVVQNDLAECRVTLRPVPTLAVFSTTLLTSVDERSSWIDVLLHNDADHPIIAVATQVKGTRRKFTDCLDASPALVVRIQDVDQATITQVDKAHTDAVRIVGHVNLLPCDQISIDFELPYSFAVAPNETAKIRWQIPRRMRAAGRGEPLIVELDKWESLVMTFRLASGDVVVVPIRSQ
jgi:hypothetical protein